MRFKQLALSAAGAIGLLGALPAHAIDMTTGDWTFSVNGNVNAHYVYASCGSNPDVVVGTAACARNANTGEDNFSNIRTGLLPAALVFGVATQQNGWDISGTFGLYPGIVSNNGGKPNYPSGNVALATTGLDVRQVFLKFGNPRFGTVKMGRDFGLFGFDAIINDMSIIGVGASTNAVGSPANTSLGSIGLGYIYADTLAQINYTTPNFNGFTATVGAFQTVDSLTSATSIGVAESAPGFHGRVRYTYGSGFVSASAITMDVAGLSDGAGGFKEESASGVAVTWKQAVGPVGLLLSAYTAEGLGTTGLLLYGFDAQGDPRDSYGGLAQLTYTTGAHKFGVNYGISKLDANDPGAVPNLVESNEKFTLGYYYSFTKNLTLLAEFSDVTSESQDGGDIQANNFNVGAIFSF